MTEILAYSSFGSNSLTADDNILANKVNKKNSQSWKYDDQL